MRRGPQPCPPHPSIAISYEMRASAEAMIPLHATVKAPAQLNLERNLSHQLPPLSVERWIDRRCHAGVIEPSADEEIELCRGGRGVVDDLVVAQAQQLHASP